LFFGLKPVKVITLQPIFFPNFAPFIIFLGKNYLQINFFTAKYLCLAAVYFLFFMSIAVVSAFFFKKILIFILFFSYFSFFQFYFFDLKEFLKIYINAISGYHVLFFIFFVSFIVTLCSNSSIFKNFVLIFLFLNILIAVNNLIPAIKTLNFKTNIMTSSFLNTKNLTSIKYPNIFYIVPDGLASPRILKNYADIDYKDSIKKFEEKGFDVPEHNYSSYNMTHLSLAALFKMNYPVIESSPIYKNTNNFYPAIRDANPEIIQYLNKNNYKFVIIPPLWGGCPSSRKYKCLTPKNNSYIKNFFQDYAISTFLQNSFLNKIMIRYNFINNENMNDSAKTALSKMKTNPEIWSEEGVFTMIHMLMPHTPYRNENCSITNRYKPPSKEGYKSTVYCTFNRIHELLDYIIKNYPSASIVVQSDHGVYSKIIKNKKFVDLSYSLIDHRLGSYTAVRGCNSNQSARLNQTNIIKYIVECLKGTTQIKLLENKSYYGFYENSPDHGKVFRVHKK